MHRSESRSLNSETQLFSSFRRMGMVSPEVNAGRHGHDEVTGSEAANFNVLILAI